jgi:succinate dehydrogenase / fumarate reductase cytochrome b subunit
VGHLITLVGYLHRTLLPLISIGNIAWLLHRLTGVAIAVYLVLHFITIGSSRQGPEVFDATLESYTAPVWKVAECLLIMAVAFHIFNGLRIIVIDFFDLSPKQKLLFWLVMGACAIVLIAVSVLFLPKILSQV